MSFQPSVAQYFNSRKRQAVDEVKKVTQQNKVLILEGSSQDLLEVKTSDEPQKGTETAIPRKIVYVEDKKIGSAKSKNRNSVKKKAVHLKSSLNAIEEQKANGIQMDIRKTFLNGTKNFEDAKYAAKESGELGETPAEKEVTSENEVMKSPLTKNVIFEVKGELSPMKIVTNTYRHVSEISDLQATEKCPKPSTMTVISQRKELNLCQIREKLSRSSRIEEMKNAVEKFNQSKIKLGEIQKKLEPRPKCSDTFEASASNSSIQKTPSKANWSPVNSLRSPLKNPSVNLGSYCSPSKLFSEPPSSLASSPGKSPFKSPAFERYQALVTEGRPALTLPFKYRTLAETFRCVDTVASMIHNRKETVTMSKLKPAVQELSRKNLTEYHLGQIKTIFPEAFKFCQEKVRSFGSCLQNDRYELIITPLLNNTSADHKSDGSGEHTVMTPACILERRRIFYNSLLDLTKKYHEEFLLSLDPPMHINRDSLTRWHPEFDLDDVPDVTSSDIPKPPNAEKITSAKEVLERSRSLFMANNRLQQALQRISSAEEEITQSSKTPPESGTPAQFLTDALKGIPKALLEKVRAKQAAKALEAMTRTPEQAKEAVRLTRLPEIARIIRNLFIAEKKSVLQRDVVLGKLSDSYRENLSNSELNDHIKLLSEKVPGWITFCNIRKTDYIKLSKHADMSRIMTRLENLAAENSY